MDTKKAVSISVDVEDGINIAMRDIFNKEIPPTERVEDNTERILELFSEHNVRSTFFILGQVSNKYPELIRKIYSEGHEIGVHGYDHLQFFKMNRKQARDQLSRAKSEIEEIIGQEVIGHRAPVFSINQDTQWALDLLAEIGFKYDSSIVPCRGPHYGWSGFPEEIVNVNTKNGQSIIEIPMTTIKVFGKKISCLGGSYFRLFPLVMTRKVLNKTDPERNPLIYLHPYEIDSKRYPDFYFEEMKSKPLLKRLMMRSRWIGRSTVLGKLERILKQNKVIRMDEIYSEAVQKTELMNYQLS